MRSLPTTSGTKGWLHEGTRTLDVARIPLQDPLEFLVGHRSPRSPTPLILGTGHVFGASPFLEPLAPIPKFLQPSVIPLWTVGRVACRHLARTSVIRPDWRTADGTPGVGEVALGQMAYSGSGASRHRL